MMMMMMYVTASVESVSSPYQAQKPTLLLLSGTFADFTMLIVLGSVLMCLTVVTVIGTACFCFSSSVLFTIFG